MRSERSRGEPTQLGTHAARRNGADHAERNEGDGIRPRMAGKPGEAGGGGSRTSRASRKRRAIVEAAAHVFVRDGFAGASVDEIADEARVSKPTVYAYFGKKEQLFHQTLALILHEAIAGMSTPLEAPLGVTDDLQQELVEYAHRWLAVLLQPQILSLRRLVLGETERFLELGQVWFESGPGRVDRALAQQFARLTQQGKLHAPDAAMAAQHFGHLVAGPPQTLLLFRTRDAMSEQELDRYIQSGVAAFLAAYGKGSEPPPK
jgi:TetR/AcrR family transcriptional repressor of mexJK operon